MCGIVNFYSDKEGEILRFLKSFYNNENLKIDNNLEWEKKYENPVEIADIIGNFIENNDKFKMNLWISLEKGTFINVTENNADKIIRYLFERYPY